MKKGLYFILPEIVFNKFEEVLGKDIPTVNNANHETSTVLTYKLGDNVPSGQQRKLVAVRKLRFTLEEFSNRFISGPNLPSGEELDEAVKRVIGAV